MGQSTTRHCIHLSGSSDAALAGERPFKLQKNMKRPDPCCHYMVLKHPLQTALLFPSKKPGLPLLEIFSPRQKQTLSKRGPQLSTWRHRQNDGDFGRQRVRSVQNYCSPERSSRAGHRFWVFLIGSQGFASCPTKCFIKSSTVLTPFPSSFLQFRAAEVMHCAKFSHRRCFLAKQERKLHIKSFPEKRNKEVLLSVAVES